MHPSILIYQPEADNIEREQEKQPLPGKKLKLKKLLVGLNFNLFLSLYLLLYHSRSLSYLLSDRHIQTNRTQSRNVD